ncbi:hypothetical protein H2O64_21410 [Kordia sp. YSTF-M3]|uniref:Uncharacterized protein n=1 Tax=Kordia aestuariivivens TaxID=2759037 RepID=A0ABR7QF94_9FLAO|nr:hypothetical protein [Kordia aestuariivivens]MBC8757242.1 hypothetical protein [Kordia aestuariivivens]
MKILLKAFIIVVVLFTIFITLFLVAFGDYTNRTHFKIYSSDKSQCVTIITKGYFRYIIDGKHSIVPTSNYIKLDVRNIDSLGDEIGVCWHNGNYEWEIVNDRAIIIENKLDTTRFKFNTSWEKDERGIPNPKKYLAPNCGTMDLLRMEDLLSGENIIIEN